MYYSGVPLRLPIENDTPRTIRTAREPQQRQEYVSMNDNPADRTATSPGGRIAVASREESGVTPVVRGHQAQHDAAGIAAVRAHLVTLADRTEAPTTLKPADRSEFLGILAQLLAVPRSPSLVNEVATRLRLCMTAPLAASEREVLFAASCALAANPDHAVVDQSLPLLLRPLRRTTLLAELLQHISCTLDTGAYAAFWPHLVNEILLGLDSSDPARIEHLYRFAGRLPAAERTAALERLDCLGALREERFTSKLFQPPVHDLLPVFCALLDSSRGVLIGQQLYRGWRSRPPRWPGSEALPVIRSYHPRNREYFKQMLLVGAKQQPPHRLVRLAGKLIVDTLTALPATRRQEPWIPEAIRALGILHTRDAEPLLDRIQSEKKCLLVPVWPRPCRLAARTAALELQSEPHSTRAPSTNAAKSADTPTGTPSSSSGE